jgi:hypothetical protein
MIAHHAADPDAGVVLISLALAIFFGIVLPLYVLRAIVRWIARAVVKDIRQAQK